MFFRKGKLILLLSVGLTCGFCQSLQAEVFPFIGLVNSDDINLRADSTTNSPIICVLKKSSKVEVVSSLYNWYKIRLPDYAPAYVKMNFLEPDEKIIRAKVTHENVNVRCGPGDTYWISGVLNKDTFVIVLSEDNGWYKIVPTADCFGWVSDKFIRRTDDLKLSVFQDKRLLNQPIVLEGTVMPYGMVLWRKATHKLITADKGVYLLKANKKLLDSLVDDQVRVSGKLLDSAGGDNQIIEVSKIEALN
jgi:uncharacterized protein YgiM (DUF1202 family)